MKFKVGQVWKCRTRKFTATVTDVVDGKNTEQLRWVVKADIENDRGDIEEKHAYFNSKGNYFDDGQISQFDLDVLIGDRASIMDVRSTTEDRIYDLARDLFLKFSPDVRTAEICDMCIADATVFVTQFDRRREQANAAAVRGEVDAD